MDLLKEIYADRDWDEIYTLLGTNNYMSIKTKASSLGIKRRCDYYTDEELEFIKINYPIMEKEEISNIMGRSYSGIMRIASSLGVVRESHWSKVEIELLKKVYPHYTNNYIMDKYFYRRSKCSVLRAAQRFSICKTKEKSNKMFDSDILIASLKSVAKKLGRTPAMQELHSYGLPVGATFARYFGSYKNACELAEIDFNISSYGKKYGIKPYFSKNKDICYSKSEMIITDFFIINNIPYKKEQMYSNFIDDIRCTTKRVDWTLDDGTFVEFFGLSSEPIYYEKMLVKIDICESNNIKLIQLYSNDFTHLNEIFADYIDLSRIRNEQVAI